MDVKMKTWDLPRSEKVVIRQTERATSWMDI
jgi:hypothetical protein